MRWLIIFYDFRFKWTDTAAIGINSTKAWLLQLVNFKNAIRTWGRTICNKIVLNLKKKNATEKYGMLQTAFRPSYMNRVSVFEWHKRFKEGRESVRYDERCMRNKEVNTTELIGQWVRLMIWVRITMLRFSGSSGKDSVRRGQHSSNWVSDISTRTIHQSTTPSLSQTNWPRRASTQFLTVPFVQTLLTLTFSYSLSSETVVMRQLRRWKKLWRRSLTRSYNRTSMGCSRNCWNGTTSTLQRKEIT